MSPKPPDQPLHLHLVPDTDVADSGPMPNDRVSQGNPGNKAPLPTFTLDHEVFSTLSPAQRDTLVAADAAYFRLHNRTWQDWCAVRAALVILRNLAMVRTGINDIDSGLYQAEFGWLLTAFSFRKLGGGQKQGEKTLRYWLFECDKHAPEIDKWWDELPEEDRLRWNHPRTVLKHYLQSKDPDAARSNAKAKQEKHDAEIEKLQVKHLDTMANRDAQIKQLKAELAVATSSADADDADVDLHADFDTADAIFAHVVAHCAEDLKLLGEVIDRLIAYREKLS